MLRLFKKLKNKKKFEASNYQLQKSVANNFDLLSNEIVTQIFSNLTPKQLAITSKTCRRFREVALNPALSLKPIQGAFFKQKRDNWSQELADIFELFYTTSTSFTEGKYTKIKDLLDLGAQIKTDYIFQALYLYNKARKVSKTISEELRYKNLIILLAEHRADLTVRYPEKGLIVEPRNMTALEYANAFLDRGMAELLNQYNKFNQGRVI